MIGRNAPVRHDGGRPLSARWNGLVAMLVVAITPFAGGCYTYRSATSGPMDSGSRVALMLNDQGRVGMSHRVGPEIARLDGSLVARTDSGYTIRVRKITDLAGNSQLWSDETVSVSQDYLKDVTVRQFSRGRTMVAIGASGLAFGAFVVTRNILVGGNEDDDPGDGGGGPGDSRRAAPLTLFRFSF